jgi:hypothetical protein
VVGDDTAMQVLSEEISEVGERHQGGGGESESLTFVLRYDHCGSSYRCVEASAPEAQTHPRAKASLALLTRGEGARNCSGASRSRYARRP